MNTETIFNMMGVGPNQKNLHDLAEAVASHLDATPGVSHDVSGEPRVAKGHGPESGEWAQGRSGADAEADQDFSGRCPNGYAVVPMEVTAYTSGPESTGKSPGDPNYGITKSGATAGPGTLAAPEAYMGRRMYVPGYGWGTVQDTGGAIKGNRLDVWFPTVEEARQWRRRRNVSVIICKG